MYVHIYKFIVIKLLDWSKGNMFFYSTINKPQPFKSKFNPEVDNNINFIIQRVVYCKNIVTFF